MNCSVPVAEDIYWVGANDRETPLFEGLWPLPRGVAYNSYLIEDEKIALIDTVKGGYFHDFLEKIQCHLDPPRSIDYLVVNHVEPDHSGSIRTLREIYPDMVVVGNPKTKQMLENFYGPSDHFLTVKEGDTLSLGRHELTFITIPMVHWPESMVCYDSTSKALFSTDAFGAFGTLDGGIFDDEVDMEYYEGETLRYYSNIVAKYSAQTQKALDKVRTLEDLQIICPAHGPIYRNNPQRAIDLYDKWSRQETERGVVVVYGSMYGNTKKAAEEIARSIATEGVEKVIMHDVSKTHDSFIVRDMWRYRGLVLASCTYNMMLFPSMNNLVSNIQNKGPKGRVLGICGSYSWASAALKELRAFGEKGKWELVEPHVEILSAPSKEDYALCRELGKNIAAAL